MTNPLRDLLNKYRWEGSLHLCSISFRERIAGQEAKREITGQDVVRITGSGVWIVGDEDTLIPFHRILRVVKDGTAVYEQRR